MGETDARQAPPAPPPPPIKPQRKVNGAWTEEHSETLCVSWWVEGKGDP